jgi:imidazolonepropionase-like amidohydrolase
MFHKESLNHDRRSSLIFLALGIIFSTLVIYTSISPNYLIGDTIHVGITSESFDYGLQKCSSFGIKTKTSSGATRKRNPHAFIGGEKPHRPTLIRNATIWNGDGKISYGVDIVFENGVFVSVTSSSKEKSFDGITIDANGRFVTPGLVDMHSHMGTDSWPGTDGSNDTNEMSDKVVRPELKSLDGFDPWDLGISVINSGGVCTSLVLPGSGTMMGGEAFAFKHRKMPSNRSEHMLLNAGMGQDDGHQWRWMKMACGENPIRFGRSLHQLPSSRLGEGYLFRERINEAFQAKKAQDQWCYEAKMMKSAFSDKGHLRMNRVFPEPLEHESLIALLRGEILLNVHCYESYDLEMMIRLSKQFGFKINTFHHALEAWTIADLLAKEGIATAIFADHWGYKKEAYGSSTKAAQVLAKAGVKVAFKSDHPVLNAQNLIYEAAKAHHYGLSPELAIKAVTSVPAERMGQDHRIGYVKKGYDADIVLWDKNPLELGAHPLKVFVDGYSTFEHTDFAKSINEKVSLRPMMHISDIVWKMPETEKLVESATYINIYGLIHSESAEWQKESKIVVSKGIITCIGPACKPSGEIVDLQQSWVIPGIIAAGVKLGLTVIEAESSSSAGKVTSTEEIVYSADGLRIGRNHSKLMDAAFKGGITTAIVSLQFTGSIGSVGTAFRTGVKTARSDAFVRRNLGMNFSVGRKAISSGLDSSISGQLTRIAKHVDTAGQPLIFDATASDHIASILHKFSGKNIIIKGGAESHNVAHEIAEAGASVLLNPTRCVPDSWFNQDCRVTGSSPSTLELLSEAGINVGVTSPDDNLIRGLIWEAGWQVADFTGYETFTDFEIAKKSAALVTWNIAKAYGIEDIAGTIAVGRRATFVAYQGVPGTLSAKVKLVVDGDIIESQTDQI